MGYRGRTLDGEKAPTPPVPDQSGKSDMKYEDVLSRKLSEARWQELKPVLGTLLSRVHFTTVY